MDDNNTDNQVEQESGDWAVQIIDLSEESEDKIVETVTGFYSLDHANAFARAYVRDSVEHCRIPRATRQEVMQTWNNYGEDVEVIGGGQESWQSVSEINYFIDNEATPMERDWRALDPRRLIDEDDYSYTDEEI